MLLRKMGISDPYPLIYMLFLCQPDSIFQFFNVDRCLHGEKLLFLNLLIFKSLKIKYHKDLLEKVTYLCKAFAFFTSLKVAIKSHFLPGTCKECNKFLQFCNSFRRNLCSFVLSNIGTGTHEIIYQVHGDQPL
jgi:hypothetical protein